MTISRLDVVRRAVDFSDVAVPGRLPPVHPGEILRDDFLRPLGLSVYRLAHELRIPRPRVNDIVRGRRRITTDTALRLSRAISARHPNSGSASRFAMTSIMRNRRAGRSSAR